jgi:hypothetical protein
MEYNIEEFNSLVEQLKTMHKPLGLRSIGCFNWEFIERPTGRNKKVYRSNNVHIIESIENRINTTWLLNYSAEKLELIIDTKVKNMGDVVLYTYKRVDSQLILSSNKLLKIR